MFLSNNLSLNKIMFYFMRIIKEYRGFFYFYRKNILIQAFSCPL